MKTENQALKPQLVDLVLSDKEKIHVKKREYKYLESPFHFHDHNVYEIVWVEKSSGKRFVGDQIDDFKENDLVLMGPHLPHKWINDHVYYNEDNELYAQTTVIHFRGDMFANIFESSEDSYSFEQLLLKASRGIRLLGNSQRKAILLMRRLNESKGLKRVIRFLQIMLLFCYAEEYELLASPDYRNSIDAKESKRLNDVYEYVMKHFQSAISLEEIAKVSCMSPTAFCRFFKNHRDITFIHFLNHIRVSHACKLLRETKSSIMDICFQCGFNNTSNFNKAFKKVKGTTPQCYRVDSQKLSEN